MKIVHILTYTSVFLLGFLASEGFHRVYPLILRSGEQDATGGVVIQHCSTIIPETYILRGRSMEPLLSDGTEIYLEKGYYQCPGNNPKRSDIIVYKSNSTEGFIIKKLLVLGGDRVSFDSEGRMLVNEEVLTNSRGDTYIFSKKEQQFLLLYITKGILRSDAYFIFGDNVRESYDSRKFGAIGLSGLIGRVRREK